VSLRNAARPHQGCSGRRDPEVKTAIAAAVDPLTARIGEIEGKLAEIETREPLKGEPGKSLTADDVRPLILEEVAKLPPAEPGKSVSVDDVRPLLDELVAALPKPEDGKSVTLDDVRPILEEAVAALPKPQDGKSVTAEDVKPLLDEMVAAIPKPQDGKSVTLDDVRPLIEAEVAKIPIPKDGEKGAPGEIALAPDDIVDQVASAVRLLAESPTIKAAEILSSDAPKKSFRFERDGQNRIIAAHQEEEAEE
jgi:hypothetical protein